MLRLEVAEVVSVREENSTLQTLGVIPAGDAGGREELAIHYLDGSSRCQPGDKVVLNTTAVRLELGTGGYHFVVCKLPAAESAAGSMLSQVFSAEKILHDPPVRTEGASGGAHAATGDVRAATGWGHIMKMRYTPLQLAVDAAEEQNSPYHHLFTEPSVSLAGIPVLIGELHSLLPSLVLALKRYCSELRIAYVMPDGAALPIRLSRHVRHLRESKLLEATVTTGQAWGGDIECVNLYTGLLAAKEIAQADTIVCLLGPGVVGTGTWLGFSAMQLAEAIHAVSCLQGLPVFVPRISFADNRARHYGISHHTRTLLRRFVLRPVILPIPRFADERDETIARQEAEDGLSALHRTIFYPAPTISELIALHGEYPEKIMTMGRTLFDDPSPFQTAVVAAKTAVLSRKWAMAMDGAARPDGGDPATLAALSAYLTSYGA